MFPVEMRLSEGWIGDFVLANEHDDGLHDCMELAVNIMSTQPGENSFISPATVEPIESVDSFLEEIVAIDDHCENEIFPVDESNNEDADDSWKLTYPISNEIIVKKPSSLPSTPSPAAVEDCFSPDTDGSVESLPFILEELTGVAGMAEEILPIDGNDASYLDIIDCVKSPPVVCTSVVDGGQPTLTQSVFPNIGSLESGKEKSNGMKDSSRRKQRIIPLFEDIDDIVPTFNAPLKFERKQELRHEDDLGIYLDNALTENLTDEVSRSNTSDRLFSKEEPKERRKRGLSNVEKRVRKKESNRNASYRYRQRKKHERESFLQYSVSLSKQLESARKGYFSAAEELLRYIKHANLIRVVQDERSQILLE